MIGTEMFKSIEDFNSKKNKKMKKIKQIIPTPLTDIETQVKAHHNFFATHQTKDINFRLKQLKKLKQAVLKFQPKIEAALWHDLHKSPEEVYLAEISIVLNEIDYHIKHLSRWAKPKRVGTPLFIKPSSSKLIHEPYGVAFVMAPWNYPFQLLINPFVGAISSGCCALLKPAPQTPTVATVIQEMIAETFDPSYVSIVQGNRQENTHLFAQKFDVICFTGSPDLGRMIMQAAAKNLTSVILELGGKSPCIVDKDANLDIAAKRIVWGKLINAGQTCIAPDYLFAHKDIKEGLLTKMKKHIVAMYGDNPQESRFFPRIVNSGAFDRVTSYLEGMEIVTGGQTDRDDLYIAPTILDNVKPTDAIMQDEIFGPILPVMTFDNLDTVLNYVNTHEKPLAFYFFGTQNKAKYMLQHTSSGGGCINDTLVHIANHNLPFGGVGNSGMGNYHGKRSFEAFSHKRGIVSTPTWIDIPLKYIPFKHFKLLKKLV